jgi:hypothetical protein
MEPHPATERPLENVRVATVTIDAFLQENAKDVH